MLLKRSTHQKIIKNQQSQFLVMCQLLRELLLIIIQIHRYGILQKHF